MRKPLSSRHRYLYQLRVAQRRLFRHFHWYFSGRNYSCEAMPEKQLAYRYKKHTSKLIRRLGDSDIRLQHNKVINLKLVAQQLDGVLIKPGDYFSFCRLVGKVSAKRGFVEGMELSFGEARSGIGGGICQASNLIHWLALHSELQVIEKANHSFDPFPDEGRILPFGSGAAIFYNYIDLVLYNPTQKTFQIRLQVTEHQLEGELLCATEREYSYHIFEKEHGFERRNGQVFRHNEIWRDTLTKNNVGAFPQKLKSERLYKNRVIVKYAVADAQIE